MQSERLIRCLPWLSAVLLAASCTAQVMQQPGTLPGRDPAGQRPGQGNGRPTVPAPEPPGTPGKAAAPTGSASQSSPDLPPSLLDKPPQPAQITLSGGLLTIHADNSSLSAILQHLASSGGMSVDGFQKDQRIFGTYGPGNPRDILSGLLQGAGYNFLMVGNTEQGTPKQLVLTASTGGGVASSPAQPDTDDQSDQDDSDNSVNNNLSPEPPMPERTAPPGAAIAPPNSDGRVKSPAEIIQELQRLRQQQQTPQ
jgi:hypothetical protein